MRNLSNTKSQGKQLKKRGTSALVIPVLGEMCNGYKCSSEIVLV